jgi:hypothetical protein
VRRTTPLVDELGVPYRPEFYGDLFVKLGKDIGLTPVSLRLGPGRSGLAGGKTGPAGL